MKTLMSALRISAAILSVLFSPIATAEAQDTSNVMIVFDASGSMWGQIDGETKIEIARDAFANAQSVWDEAGQNIGLIAYGHRRKGDCQDIEMMVAVGGNNGAAVADQIQSLRPKGKTPLTDAIRLAAAELRYREEAATVLLFSDGIETCNADPCSLATELEDDGIDFTAHVIGFGLGSDTDRTELQCIADNTGGRFIEAQDAAGLQEAFTKVADAPVAVDQPNENGEIIRFQIVIAEAEGTARPVQLTLRATNIESGEKQVLGTLRGADQIIQGLAAELTAGGWKLEALSEGGHGEISVTLAAETQKVEIPFTANDTSFVLLEGGPYRLGVEHAFFLGVTDPLQANADYTVALFPAGATEYDQRIDWETRFGSDTTGFTEHGLMAPETAGDYEIIVLQGYDLGAANARFPVTFSEDAPLRWKGVTQGEPGQAVPIKISGDTYRNNTLALRSADGTEVVSQWLQAYVAEDGAPKLTLPDRPGVYELIYRATSQDGEISLGQITVGDVVLEDDADAVAPPTEATMTGPPTAQEPKPSSAPEPKRSVPETEFQCTQPACLYFSNTLALGDIPIHQGFGAANEKRDNEGRPSFDVVNLSSGDVITVHPIVMAGEMDCMVVSENGRNEGLQNSTLCMTQNSNGQTVAQFETLEAWVANENEKLLEAELAEDRKAHAETMGEDAIFTSSTLNTAWTIYTNDTFDVVGIVSFDLAGEDTTSVNAILTLYPSEATGLEVQVTVPLVANIQVSGSTEVTGITAKDGGSLGVQIQLSRPPAWDGQDNVFHGLTMIGSTGKVLRVGVF
ncbi:MAG: VWA domain-containing protein [Shimia sp.]|uniref:vWA domain-containing protein n=1 Tax=Shimia sp. TaxID=1954381 RepID=UPI0025F115CA|nr:VWA domain-containing protein [Shimia sp.]MCH2069659.1 VWA domain-containing protein [Shimia sp.]